MALPADLMVLKDSPVYQPVLRSVLKSQIQLLVQQLCETGEETLILTANIKNQDVTQLGSESGKQFVEMYDDFKSEFLGFCQRREKKRKIESPQQAVPAKRDKAFASPVFIHATKQSPKTPASVVQSQSPSTANNSPKVSAARIIVSQGQTPVKVVTSQHTKSVSQSTEATQPTGHVVIAIPRDGQETELSESNAALGVLGMPGSEFVGYEEIEEHEVEGWDPNTVEETAVTEQQEQSTSTPTRTKSRTKGSDSTVLNVSKGPTEDIPVNFQRMFDKATSCPECGKLFIRGDALKLHMLSHTGEYPYQCEHCGAEFRKKRSMVMHIQKKHPEV